MAFPKLETPTYEIVVPSSNEKIRYRPFLVKEYKILLTALETDADEIHRIIKELVYSCTFEKLNVDTLPNFDLEYLFLNIRAKSIGEISNLSLTCQNCSDKVLFQLDMTKAKIVRDEKHSKKIQIQDDVILEMRYPTFQENVDILKQFGTDKLVDLVCFCIDGVYTKDTFIKTSEYSKEELIEFVNSFSKEQFEKLEYFFLTTPKVVQEIKETCTKCGTVNETSLEGLENFFV